MTHLGIDPGIAGGIAFLFPADGDLLVYDIPTVGGEVDIDTLAGILVTHGKIGMATIERAQAMPKQGVSSTFKYGVAYGSLRAAVTMCRIPYQLVSPRIWKKHFGLDSDKEKARALAIRLWPGRDLFSRKKDHGRAEAALIALYGAKLVHNHVKQGMVQCQTTSD